MKPALALALEQVKLGPEQVRPGPALGRVKPGLAPPPEQELRRLVRPALVSVRLWRSARQWPRLQPRQAVAVAAEARPRPTTKNLRFAISERC